MTKRRSRLLQFSLQLVCSIADAALGLLVMDRMRHVSKCDSGLRSAYLQGSWSTGLWTAFDGGGWQRYQNLIALGDRQTQLVFIGVMVRYQLRCAGDAEFRQRSLLVTHSMKTGAGWNRMLRLAGLAAFGRLHFLRMN